MSSRLDITRRDFLNGMALSLAAGGTLSPLELMAMSGRAAEYPPALTGMRGSHPGSFDVAHDLAREGKTWPRPASLTDDIYDLVVVGGGISGLSAALMFRQQAGPDARILVLDNHDDFGGHAKRNEFSVDGKTLIGYGGSQSIDTPGNYSREARQLLTDIGVDTKHFYDYFDQSFFADRELGQGIYFSAEHYGRDATLPIAARQYERGIADNVEELIRAYPLLPEAQESFIRLLTDARDYLAGMEAGEKIALMTRVSYSDYLRKYADVHEDVVTILRDFSKSLWGFGYDALSALEGYRLGMPGTAFLDDAGPIPSPYDGDEPYIFHFPDGNAGVARGLVRQLIPAALPGHSMEDLVATRVDYGILDLRCNRTRIRLNSTAVDVRNVENANAVDVTYVRDGKAHRVRGRHSILACYNHTVPHICPETPASQAKAIRSAVKVPLVYINVALRNWRAFDNLGFERIYTPQSTLMHSFTLDFPVSVGNYKFSPTPNDPVVVHGVYAPSVPDQGLDERQQHIVGRLKLYEMTFADFEHGIVRDMDGALAAGGFDAERDIAGITVNRWPHGYAYEYNELYDPPEWNRENGPHIAGAAQIGRISIANSDASAYAYVDGAIDAAARAVKEQLDA